MSSGMQFAVGADKTSSSYSDAEITRRLKVAEDSFVERKSFGDWKKDAVFSALGLRTTEQSRLRKWTLTPY
jgi:hypothetical protein